MVLYVTEGAKLYIFFLFVQLTNVYEKHYIYFYNLRKCILKQPKYHFNIILNLIYHSSWKEIFPSVEIRNFSTLFYKLSKIITATDKFKLMTLTGVPFM